MKTIGTGRRRIVYVCHPYAEDTAGNIQAVRQICRELVEEGLLPIGPHIYLPQFVDENTEREEALSMCTQLVELCDELRVYGDRVTGGMFREIDHAARVGVAVRWMIAEAA